MKSSIKSDSCLAACLRGGGGGKEIMTFQTTSHNHVGIYFLHSAGREGGVECQ